MNLEIIRNDISSRPLVSLDPAVAKANVGNAAVSSTPPFIKRKCSRSGIKVGVDKKKKEIGTGCRPIAGSTSVKIENPEDSTVGKNGRVFAGWREVDPSTLQVRGIGYTTRRKKEKVNSPGDLYRCVKADVFESQHRYPDMADRVVLPKVEFDNEDSNTRKTWVSPDMFVISIALPTSQPTMRKGKNSNDNNDGAGFTVTMYFAMQLETRDILRRITADGYDPQSDKINDGNSGNKSKINAVRLLEKWCRRAPSDDNFMSRFKVLPRAENLAEIGLPAWISKFNAKPFLVKRPGHTGFLYSHPEKSCMEFDVSFHPFPYLARKAIYTIKDTIFKKAIATFAFCLEARDDDELPECLLGAFQLCYPDPVNAIQGEDLFTGKLN